MGHARSTLPWVLSLGAVLVAAALGRPRATADGPAKPTYIGADACKKCHLKQFKSWKETGLAKAFDALKPGASAERKKAGGLDPAKDFSSDPKCLRCHVTGWGADGGYPAPKEGKAPTPEEQQRAALLVGVTCEACHGPGSLYSVFMRDHKEFKLAEVQALGATSPPKAEQCNVCHVKECPTMKADYAFDFEKERKSPKMHEHVPLRYAH